MDEITGVTSEVGTSIFAYWQSKCQEQKLPCRADINPAEIITALPSIYMIDVTFDPLDFTYRLIGTGIVSRSARDYTGVRLMDLSAQMKPSIIWDLFEQAVLTKQPAYANVPYLNMPSSYVEKQALPLSSDGETIDMLIGSIVFEEERYPDLKVAAM